MKRLILMSMMAVFCLTTACAQKTVVSQKSQKVYEVVEVMPEFPGGMPALIEFLSTNVKYPEDAAKQKVEGRVMVSFVVETDGSISDVKIMRRVFPSLDDEALRVVKMMPKWLPGKMNGEVVRVHYTLPISYRLR